MRLVIIDSKGIAHQLGEYILQENPSELRRMAKQTMESHGHTKTQARQAVVRDNCAACVLQAGLKKFNPNYGGWLRVYIQAGIDVPADVVIKELNAMENQAYKREVCRDLVTFSHKHRGVVYC